MEKYKKIYHISDIHIRNTEEHKVIYEHVFKNLYDYLSNVEKGMIVITGDILHNKEKQTSTSQLLCVDLLSNLSKIMTTVLIPGNHDFNEKNKTIEDSLWSIIYKRKFKNLYYLRESGIYTFNNITFGVSSLIDDIFIDSSSLLKDDNIKIGLYHGAISNSTNSKGFEFSGKSITKFDGYDLVLLGDIHKFQYLNDTKTVAYASSLISQNFSETDKYHGVLVWDLETLKSDYHIINNEYRYEELTLNNNKIYYNDQEILLKDVRLGQYSKVRINAIDTDRETYNNIVKDLIKLYPSINIIHNKLITSFESKKEYNDISIDSIIKNEIDAIPDDIREKVRGVLMDELKSSINNLSDRSCWRLLSLQFSNMLSYGKDNIIDFSKLTPDEITGIFGENSLGKSSLIDILLFSLFDNYSRNNQNKHKTLNGSIINNNEKYFECIVRFSINNNIYEIHKTGERKLAKSKITNDSFKYIIYDFSRIVDNNKISLNGQDRIETLNNITNIIGTYNDFCVSSLCLQYNTKGNRDFYIMSSIERKAFLNEKVNIDIYSDIENKYKDLYKTNKTNIKFIIESSDYKDYDNDTLYKIEKLKTHISISNDELINLQKEIDKLYINEKALINKLLPINKKYNNYDKDELENLLKDHKNKMGNYNILSIDKDDLHNQNLNYVKQMTNISETYDITFDMNNRLNMIDNELETLKNDVDINMDIYELKSKIIKGSKLLNMGIINSEILDYLRLLIEQAKQYNRDNIILNNISKNRINELLQIRNQYTYSNDVDMNKYYAITDYNRYIKDNLEKLNNFDIINNDKIVADANRNILILINKVKETKNINCECCIQNDKEIDIYIKNLGISNDYNNINCIYNDIIILKNEVANIQKCRINDIMDNIDMQIKLEEAKVFNYDYIKCIENLEYIYNIFEQHNLLLNVNKLAKYFKLIDEKRNIANIINNNILQNKIDINNKLIDEYKVIQQNIISIEIIEETLYNNDHNRELMDELNKIKLYQKTLTEKIIRINRELEDMKSEMKLIKTKYMKYKELSDNLIKLEIDMKLYGHIMQLTGMKGIPRKIINKKLEYLEKEVNGILSKFINKNIYITKEIDDINIILLNNKGDRSDFGGGMETFILTLAFKIALSEVFNSNKCGILFIDENVSVLDKEHVSKFNIISDFLKRYYNNILLITHIDGFQDYTTDRINIIKYKTKSKVIYT